jgi:hypothetical protein
VQERLKSLQDYVHLGIEKWMTGRDKLRLWLARDQCLLQCDAGIAIEHRIAPANEPVALFQDRRHTKDFKPPFFTFGDPSAERRERFPEECADKCG